LLAKLLYRFEAVNPSSLKIVSRLHTSLESSI
jgi:hypothetical protein